MENQLKSIVMLCTAVLLVSCNNATKTEESNATSAVKEEVKPVISHVMTKEEQTRLTPDAILQEFTEGNKRFQSGTTTVRDHSKQARKSAPGQYPKAVVLSCVDSRVPVEDVFDQGLGDIFVGRVAGNFVNEDLLGSMEFACKVSGAKLVLVMGHQHCGAIKGAIDDVKLGNITAMLSKIKPAVAISQDFNGEKTSKNDKFVKYVSENNVIYTIGQIRKRVLFLKKWKIKVKLKL